MGAALSAKPQGERVLLYRHDSGNAWLSTDPSNEGPYRNAGFHVRYATLDSEETK